MWGLCSSSNILQCQDGGGSGGGSLQLAPFVRGGTNTSRRERHVSQAPLRELLARITAADLHRQLANLHQLPNMRHNHKHITITAHLWKAVHRRCCCLCHWAVCCRYLAGIRTIYVTAALRASSSANRTRLTKGAHCAGSKACRRIHPRVLGNRSASKSPCNPCPCSGGVVVCTD